MLIRGIDGAGVYTGTYAMLENQWSRLPSNTALATNCTYGKKSIDDKDIARQQENKDDNRSKAKATKPARSRDKDVSLGTCCSASALTLASSSSSSLFQSSSCYPHLRRCCSPSLKCLLTHALLFKWIRSSDWSLRSSNNNVHSSRGKATRGMWFT